MPCLSFKAKNSSGFICSADMHREKQRCCVCGRPAAYLCDYRELSAVYETDEYWHKIGKKQVPALHMCSKPLCMWHSCHMGPDEDYCPEHSSEIQIMRSRKAEELHAQRCRERGIDYEKNDE